MTEFDRSSGLLLVIDSDPLLVPRVEGLGSGRRKVGFVDAAVEESCDLWFREERK